MSLSALRMYRFALLVNTTAGGEGKSQGTIFRRSGVDSVSGGGIMLSSVDFCVLAESVELVMVCKIWLSVQLYTPQA